MTYLLIWFFCIAWTIPMAGYRNLNFGLWVLLAIAFPVPAAVAVCLVKPPRVDVWTWG